MLHLLKYTWNSLVSFSLIHVHLCILQISEEEMKLAMTFLKEQLGEEELKAMLEQLQMEGSGGIDVKTLMRHGLPDDDDDESSKSHQS
jgi:hypothetical protein